MTGTIPDPYLTRFMKTLFQSVLVAFVAILPAHAEKKPMNVVVMLADDWRYDTLGAAGNPIVKTPHLDKLAANGVNFTHACVTTSICGVSRASIMTGQWMSRHGNKGFKRFVTPWAETYPGILRAKGYHTGHVGKWHCGKFNPKNFDFGRSYSGRHWIKDEEGNKIHVTAKNLKDSMDFLDNRPKDKPFLLNLCFFAAHAEDPNPKQFLPQPHSMKLYTDVTIPNPEMRSEKAHKNLPPFLQTEKNEGVKRYHWRFTTDEKFQTMMKYYYRLCTEVDEVCGAVIERLRKEGELENTLIIFLGDNGYFHGDRMLADKWYPYEESIRVPMIVFDPRIPKDKRGQKNDEFALNVDLAPTILKALGFDIPKGVQGQDLAPLYVHGPNPKANKAWRKEFFYQHGTITSRDRIPASEAVVTKTMKYSWWPEWKYEELFDLTKDPLEQNNLVKDPTYTDQLASMRKKHGKLADVAK